MAKYKKQAKAICQSLSSQSEARLSIESGQFIFQ